MEQKHTLGPWEVCRPDIRSMYKSIVNTDGQPLAIAHIDTVDGFSGSSEANARLIAAAPELLEALESVRYAIIEDSPIQLRQIEALIAKARNQ